jgi:hypothetical protein
MIQGFEELIMLLDSRGIPYHHSTYDSAEYTINCPFCFEGRFRFGFNTRKNKAHCFNCEFSSRNALEDLSEALDLGILTSTDAALSDERGGADHTSNTPKQLSLPEDFVPLNEPPKDKLYRRALNYLLLRGVSKKQIEEKKIGISFVGRYAYRIIFPVYHRKKLEGIVARDFTGQQEPKYLNSAGLKTIYNLPKHKNKKAVLCEGVFDCLALERSLPPDYDVLALLGHGMTERQEDRLEDYGNIILWPDADLPGLIGFCGIGKQLALHHHIWVVPPYNEVKDAAEMTPEMRLMRWEQRVRLTERVELSLRVGVSLHE